ncbi:hypothetical protein CHS0354_042176 [Potamilus streckersoni]|uniref:Uncharacterized protein n=1 Tax=Potamilus streckersoni TaxID=2493646 RepID=A0AAE0TLQ5_9BIVA|nr:hypothetical protein CHS0354_042176 [Potamilus streckersoni]
MSEHQPPRTIPEEKVFPDVNGIYSELVQPIKAEFGEDPTSSIYVNSDSIRKKQSPPSFKPPPPPAPRPVTIRQKSRTTKPKEVSKLHISENHECKKMPKGCNFKEKNAALTRQDDKHVNEDAIIKTKETSWFGDNPDSTTLLPNPIIRHDFDRISQMPDAVKEAYMTERFAKCKRDKSIVTIKEETQTIDNSNIEVASVNRETTANNIEKSMESAGKGADIKCNVHFKLDSDKIEKESDEEGYVRMGYVGTKTATAHVISPAVRRQATPKRFGSLSKSQLVRCLEECGLKELAAVCQNEKLDGQFLEKHVSDEDLMQDPFLLTRFQIRKLRAIIDGWRPISDLKNDVDTGSG